MTRVAYGLRCSVVHTGGNCFDYYGVLAEESWDAYYLPRVDSSPQDSRPTLKVIFRTGQPRHMW